MFDVEFLNPVMPNAKYQEGIVASKETQIFVAKELEQCSNLMLRFSPNDLMYESQYITSMKYSYVVQTLRTYGKTFQEFFISDTNY